MSRLYDTTRTTLRSSQVAKAIADLVDDSGLPIALTFADVAAQLVANELMDSGVVTHRVRTMLYETNLVELEAKGMLKAGAEAYATETGRPFVPVTEWFFDHVYSDELRDVLDAMAEEEVQRSIPRKKHYQYDALNDQPNKDVVLGGKHAGVVFFAPDSNSPLLLRNEQRRFQRTQASIGTFVKRGGRILPPDQRPLLESNATKLKAAIECSSPTPIYKKAGGE